MTNITRRAAVTGLALLPAASAQASPASPLPGMIAAYHQAEADFAAATAQVEKLEAAHPDLVDLDCAVPVPLGGAAEYPGVVTEAFLLLAKQFDKVDMRPRERAILCRLLDRGEARAQAALKVKTDAWRERQTAAGLTAAWDAERDAEDAEYFALRQILVYQPHNAGEAAERSAFIEAELTRVRGGRLFSLMNRLHSERAA